MTATTTTAGTTAAIVDVIIPTTCDAARAQSLLRAVDSLLDQRGAVARPVIVANGPRVEPRLMERLATLPRVRVLRQEEGSLPRAIHTGRVAVRAPFFAFLDDDDAYMPDALAQRLERLQAADQPDAVASNGYSVRPDGGRRLLFAAMAPFAADPLATLADTNWLSSCGGLYRTAAVTVEPFAAVPKFFEWTTVAFRLAQRGHSIGFVEEPTFIITETPGSLSRSLAYDAAAPDFVRGLLGHSLPPHVREAFRRKLVRLEHHAAERHLGHGNRLAALVHHLRSLATPYGLRRNASFTLRLLTGLPPGATA